MTRIDRNDQVARLCRRVLDLDRGRRHRLRARRQIDDEPVTVTIVGSREEALGVHRLREVEHDAHRPLRPVRDPHLLDGPGTGRHRPAAMQMQSRDVQHQAIRILEQGDMVLHARGEIQDDARVIRTRPETDIAKFGCAHGQAVMGDDHELSPHLGWEIAADDLGHGTPVVVADPDA